MSAAPQQAPAGLGRRAAKGAAVTLGGQALRILVQVASVSILARLLSPGDYGLVAMVVVIVGIGEVLRDFGLSSAAIQARDLTAQQRTNLFWANTAIGATLAAAVFLGAGLVAAVYDRPELVAITHVLAATFVLNGVATQYRASLVRSLRFHLLAAADLAAPVVALAVAVTLALNGAGYWALVAQTVTQSAFLLVVLVSAGRWLPGVPRRGAGMRPLLAYGGRLVGVQLVGYLTNNVDTFVIGLRFGPVQLGVYTRAFHLLMAPLTQLRSPTTTVALPVLSKLQDDDERYGDFVVRGQLALGYTLVAGLALVAGAAVPLTSVLLGPQWDQVAPILRLLAVAGMFHTVSYVAYWVYLSRGLTGTLLRMSFVTAAIQIVCIAVGSMFGVLGVAAGYAISPGIAWPISLWWLSRRTVIPARTLAVGALRILALVTVAGLVTFGVTVVAAGIPDLVSAALGMLAGVAAIALAALVVPQVRRDLAGVAGVVRMAVDRRKDTT